MFNNEIKIFENDEYIQSITLADFIEHIKSAVKNEWIITTEYTNVIVLTGFRKLEYRF